MELAMELFFDNKYLFVFIVSLLEVSVVSWFLPFAWLVVVGGLLANNIYEVFWLIVAGTVGEFISFLLAYESGKKKIVKIGYKKMAKMIKESGVGWFETGLISGVSRFWLAYIAGESKYDRGRFYKYSLVASIIWTSGMIMVGYAVRQIEADLTDVTKQIGLVSVVLFLVFALHFGKKLWSYSKMS